MTQRRYDSRAPSLVQMGRLVVPVLSPEREAQLLARSIKTVDQTLERVAKKRSFWREHSGVAAAAAAAVTVLALTGGWLLGSRQSLPMAPHVVAAAGKVVLVRAGADPMPVSEGASLTQGDELVTTTGAHASLALADQAGVEVGSETRVRVAEAPDGHPENERLELSQGEVSLRVPKLEVGRTLSVSTPDALVTVRGTRFTVNVERGGASVVTRVSVLEGRVEVANQGRTLFLSRGERWSSLAQKQSEERLPAPTETAPTETPNAANTTPEAAEPKEASVSEAMPPPASPAVAKHAIRAEARVPHGSSTLAEENGMYHSALRANQNGDAAASLATLESFLRKYPRSPLVQSARVEHFRVLLQMGNVVAAAREARRYLSEYPSGFARAEARQIALRGLGNAD